MHTITEYTVGLSLCIFNACQGARKTLERLLYANAELSAVANASLTAPASTNGLAGKEVARREGVLWE